MTREQPARASCFLQLCLTTGLCLPLQASLLSHSLPYGFLGREDANTSLAVADRQLRKSKQIHSWTLRTISYFVPRYVVGM